MDARPFAEVLADAISALIDRPGVHAVGEGIQDGHPCIVVLADPSVHDALPREVDGHQVAVHASGEITSG